MLRWVALWFVVAVALVLPSPFEERSADPWTRLARAQEATMPAEGEPSATPTPPGVPTPTPTQTLSIPQPDTPTVQPPIETATATPVEETPTASPTATPTPIASETPIPTATVDALPPIAAEQDPEGAVAVARIEPNGGRIATTDGRAVVDFPAGAVTEPVDVTITREAPDHPWPAHPDAHFIARWQFDATTLEGTPVHQFASPLTFSLRFASGEIPPDLDPNTMAFWTLDEESQTWTAIQSQVQPGELRLEARADHFSDDAITANSLLSVSPLLDGKNVGLQSLSSELVIPVEVPPGRGGLAPQLAFSYSSDRLQGMRGFSDHAGWAGLGWELDVPHVQVVRTTGFAHRAFLSMNGIGGEMMREGMDGGLYIWRLRNETYLKIRSSCIDFECEMTLWDQSGTKYAFGGTSAFERWYRDSSNESVNYRLDIRYIEDVFGNRIDFEYFQQKQDGPPSGSTEVTAAYPKRITYNGGNAEILFNGGDPENNGYEVSYQNPNDATQMIRQRKDTPHDMEDNTCSQEDEYVAPRIRETRKLTGIDVKVSGSLVRRYVPTFRSIDSSDEFDIACWPGAGGSAAAEDPEDDHGLQLDSIAVTDRQGNAYDYTTTAFAYLHSDADIEMQYIDDDDNDVFEYARPLLDRVTNGFDGYTDFSYELNGEGLTGDYHWERRNVVSVTKSSGAAQPDVVTTFTHSAADPQYWKKVNPYDPNNSDDFAAEYRGFTQVTEADASGNKVVHKYKPTANWSDEPLAGREYEVEVRDASNALWSKSTTTFGVRNVARNLTTTGYLVNFVAPSTVTNTLRDSTQTSTSYTYGTYGHPIEVANDGVSGTNDDVKTITAVHENTTAWVFAPKYSEQVDPADNLLSCTRMYYDGATSTATAPTRGLSTATSSVFGTAVTKAQCESSSELGSNTSTNTYQEFDAYGNMLKKSVPTHTTPESSGGSGAYGWVPGSLAYTSTTYDTTHRVFPTSQTNAASQATSTTYDFVLGKPTQITSPNGKVVNIVYDDLGRVIRWYDNLDNDTQPTQRFTYTWGTLPHKTLIETRTIHGVTGAVRKSTSCLDGFGREIEHRESFSGANRSSVRVDYDARGLKAVETNPVDIGDTPNCDTPAAVTGRNRVAYTYDPLGNVIQTTAISSTQVSSSLGTADYNGLTTTLTDPLNNVTRQVRNLGSRTLSVEEPTASPPAVSTTVYQYDRIGQLTKVTDAAGNETDLVYDRLGRKTSMSDPDMGDWSYTYDAGGNLLTQTDYVGITTTLQYDALQRLTQKSYSNGDASVSFTYDDYDDSGPCGDSDNTDIGMLTKMTDGAGVQHSCYDTRGRLEESRRTIDSVAYDMAYEYDPLGQVSEMTYPDGDVVSYNSTTQGNITSMSSDVDGAGGSSPQTLASSITPTPWGALASMALGNGLTTSHTYDTRMRLTRTQTGGVQDVSLTYDAASNIKTVVDNVTGLDDVEYEYDHLNRLSEMEIEGVVAASYTYDAIGNLLTKEEGSSNDIALSYPTPGASSVRPHAVASTTGTQGGASFVRSFTYDKNGNLAGSHETSYRFDAENRLVATFESPKHATATGFQCADVNGDNVITILDIQAIAAQNGKGRTTAGWNFHTDLNWDGTTNVLDTSRESANPVSPPTPCNSKKVTTYTYDGNGTQLKRALDDGSWTVYIGGVFEKTSAGGVRKYYGVAGKTIAVRDGTGAGTVSYLLHDHLGGTTGVADGNGTLVEEMRYWPYGGVRDGAVAATDRRFTGQREEVGDAQLGLYNYKARFYSASVGRFISADPITEDGLNRFMYVRGNPTRYTDPTGNCVRLNGDLLPCDQRTVLNILSCSISFELCQTVYDLMDAPRPPHVQGGRDFAVWAVTQSTFHVSLAWYNPFDRPFRGPRSLSADYPMARWDHRGAQARVDGLLRSVDEYGYTPRRIDALQNVIGRTQAFVEQQCRGRDCRGIGFNFMGIAIGLNGGNFGTTMASMGLHSAEVQNAWYRHRQEQTDESYDELWRTIGNEAFAVTAQSAFPDVNWGLAMNLVDLWMDVWCPDAPEC